MARPREFDTDKALQGAMDVFWSQGYDGASLPELLKGMGITRGSLYKAFTDKKALFMLVLDQYEREAVAPAVQMLSDVSVPDGQDRIKNLFNHVVESVRSGDRRGCLLCTAAAGPAYDDAEIAEAVHQLLEKMQHGFEIALADSKDHSKLNADQISDLADLLITQYTGLRILARSQASIEMLDRGVASLVRLLETRS